MASFISMPWELSKSKGIGSSNIKKPIITKMALLIILVTKSGKNILIIFPSAIERVAKNIDIINRISFASKFILVFFNPYVMPIPRESILEDKASNIELNITTSVFT